MADRRIHTERQILHYVDELLDTTNEPDGLFTYHQRDTLLQEILRLAAHLRTLPLETTDSPRLSSRPTDTQRAAARLHAPRRNSLRLDILTLIDADPTGLTCDDVERRLNRAHTSVSSAIYSLARQGWLWDSGQRRNTRQQTPAIIWRITTAGHHQLRNLYSATPR